MVQHLVLLKESGWYSERSSQIFPKPSQLRGLSSVIILFYTHIYTHTTTPHPHPKTQQLCVYVCFVRALHRHDFNHRHDCFTLSLSQQNQAEDQNTKFI